MLLADVARMIDAHCAQRQTGLPLQLWRPGVLQVLMIGFIGRLDYQKGADLVLGIAPWLLAQDVQLVCLGTGDPSLEARPLLLHTICARAA